MLSLNKWLVPAYSICGKARLHPYSLAQCLKLFQSDDMIELLAEHRRLYADQKQLSSKEVTPENIRAMLAIMTQSSYSTVVNKRLYLSKEDDVFSTMVSNTMRRDTSEQLMHVLHVADNSKIDLTESDPMSKIIAIFDIANIRNNKLMNLSRGLSIDEAMVP